MEERARLLEFARAQPFRPFMVSLTNGRSFVVNGPEWLIVGARMSTFGYMDEEGYDRSVIFHHRHINTIEAYDTAQSNQAG